MCNHLTQEPRYRIDKLGRRYYGYQCLDCGRLVSRIKNEKATGLETLFDEELAIKDIDRIHQTYEDNRLRRELEYQKKQEERAKQYKLYLKSPEWKSKRKSVLSRDGYTCQACLEAPATEVHHLTYDHIFNEPLFDLVSVCGPCHQAITEMDHSPGRW